MKGWIWVPLAALIALVTIGAAPARAQSEVTPFVLLGSAIVAGWRGGPVRMDDEPERRDGGRVPSRRD